MALIVGISRAVHPAIRRDAAGQRRTTRRLSAELETVAAHVVRVPELNRGDGLLGLARVVDVIGKDGDVERARADTVPCVIVAVSVARPSGWPSPDQGPVGGRSTTPKAWTLDP